MSVYKELGNKLKDFISAKTEEVDDKVEAIDKHERYVNTDLDYVCLQSTEDYQKTPAVTMAAGTNILTLFDQYNGNLNIDSDGYILLSKGKKYYIHGSCLGNNAISNLFIQDKNGNRIGNVGYLIKTDQDSKDTSQPTISTIFEATEDTYIGMFNDREIKIYPAYSYLTIQEVGRQIVIDPVEHVNESQGIEDTPVGHIIAHMGTVAPKHYLICDGTEYNIADYPYLAQHIEDNFGSVNFFGGDGETTFAVPDLRGEFLRGTGTGVRNTGSGANVGEHQNATQIPSIGVNTTTTYALWISSNAKIGNSAGIVPSETDSLLIDNSKKTGFAYNRTDTWASDGTYAYTSRPTNTSVLYCIKYEPTYFMVTTRTTTQEEVDAVKEQNSLLQEQITALQEQNTLLTQEITQLSEILDNLNNTEV